MPTVQKEGSGMSDLVKLETGGDCKICGRKNCANPGWPSWMAYVCMEIGIERLRSHVAGQRESLRVAAAHVSDLEAEVKELRSALSDARFTPEPR